MKIYVKKEKKKGLLASMYKKIRKMMGLIKKKKTVFMKYVDQYLKFQQDLSDIIDTFEKKLG